MKNITVIKQDINHHEIWSYKAREIWREENTIMLEAYFNRKDTPLLEIIIKNNDRFIEFFFRDRWYNIFQIYDRDDNALKGWYCDICKPACFSKEKITYVDLSLDLFVYPDGKFEVLDQDEFNVLDLDQQTRQKALESLWDLKNNFQKIVNDLPTVRG